MQLNNYKNQRVTIMGLGLHGGGMEAAKWFAKHGARVTVTDLRTKKQLQNSIKSLASYKIRYILGKHRNADFINTDLIIKNPGVRSESPYLKIAKKHHIKIESDLSIFLRNTKNLIIGVTGTKGKSTTTSLIFHILKSAGKKPVMAGNIRISPLKILSVIDKNTPIILELSSWQLEDIKHIHWSPHIAILTNIMPDHLNRYHSMEEYCEAKSIITKFQSFDDYFIVNYDNYLSRKIAQKTSSRVFWYSLTKRKKIYTYVKNNIIFSGSKQIIAKKDLIFPGSVNLGNILAATTAAQILGISCENIRNAIKTFKGVPGRMELVKTIGQVSFINDTTATTPDATISALKSVKGNIILIAGGSDKKLKYEVLAKKIKSSVKKLILLPGSATVKIKKQLALNHFNRYVEVNSMREALQKVKEFARNLKNVSVLLSPGAASFGLFLNEFDRGDQFEAEVKNFKYNV